MTESSPSSGHRERLETALEARRSAITQARQRERALSVLGLAWLVVGMIVFLASFDDIVPLPWWAAGLLWIGLLVPLIVAREKTTSRRRRLEHATTWLQQSIARLDDQWRFGQVDGSEYEDDEHLYASDLDLFGPHSLFERMNETGTALGRDALAAFLKGQYVGKSIAERQEAIRALSEDHLFRETLAVEQGVFREQEGRTEVERAYLDDRTRGLLGWGTQTPPPAAPASSRIIWILCSAATLTALGLCLFLVWPWAAFIPFWFMNYIILGRSAHEVEEELERFDTIRLTLEGWTKLLHIVETKTPAAPILNEAKAALLTGSVPASEAIEKLRRIVDRLAQRQNVFWALTVDVVGLVDLHVREQLRNWKREYGEHIDGWLLAVAKIEGLASLAGWCSAREDDAWPTIAESTGALSATQVVHPLLPRGSQGNDIQLAHPGTLMLITGSNMSGKSTFLRTLGLATLLSRLGLPVPAKSWTSPELAIATCMRTQDDLSQGSSRFHAEVKRLAACVQAAQTHGPTLILLDEILAGTNSKERHAGTQAVLRGLSKTQARSLIATHDLALTNLVEDGSHTGGIWHFRDTVINGEMKFDYLLRPGPSTSTNALRVMRQAGLDVPEAVE